jgi:hypothetical protein
MSPVADEDKLIHIYNLDMMELKDDLIVHNY